MRRGVVVATGLVAVAVIATAVAVVTMASGDGRPAGDEAGEADGDGPETSAARGAEGTRQLDVVPDELPEELVVDDARDVEAVVARSGDDWSATVNFLTERNRDELADHADGTLEPLGFVPRGRSFDDTVTVIVYDGDDGSVVTVTLREQDALTSLHAIRVSP